MGSNRPLGELINSVTGRTVILAAMPRGRLSANGAGRFASLAKVFGQQAEHLDSLVAVNGGVECTIIGISTGAINALAVAAAYQCCMGAAPKLRLVVPAGMDPAESHYRLWRRAEQAWRQGITYAELYPETATSCRLEGLEAGARFRAAPCRATAEAWWLGSPRLNKIAFSRLRELAKADVHILCGEADLLYPPAITQHALKEAGFNLPFHIVPGMIHAVQRRPELLVDYLIFHSLLKP